jgi:hypothetical protein
MKLDRIIWGILLLFIGGVVLLDNFDVIDFYWMNAFRFIPVLIIILGVNILFSKNNSETGNIISLCIMVIALSVLFVYGQQKPKGKLWWGDNIRHTYRSDSDDDDDYDSDDEETYTKLNFGTPFLAGDANKTAVLNIFGEVTSFSVKGATDSLFAADVKKRRGDFSLENITTDSTNVLTFRTKNHKRGSWSMGNGNDVELHLNTNPIWRMHINMGVGSVDFDLSNYKVRTFNFDGGASDLEVKIGSLLPITDINVKSGVTSVKVQIPAGSGCRIKTKTGLSSRDFDGFTKTGDDTYETPNYNSSANKIFINFNGGLTSFEVKKY